MTGVTLVETEMGLQVVLATPAPSPLMPISTSTVLGSVATWNIEDRFLVSGGLRRDWFSIEVPSYTNEDNNIDVIGGDRNVNGTAFNAGVVYKATPEVSLFANFAQGFSLPDIARLLRRPPEGFNFGEDLELSSLIKVNNYEIGVRGEWLKFQASLAGFYNESDLGASVLFDDPKQPGRLVRAPRRDYGLEAAVDWQPGAGFALGGTLTYAEAEDDIDNDGEFLAISSFDVSPGKLTTYVEHESASNWRNRLQLLYVGNRERALKMDLMVLPLMVIW